MAEARRSPAGYVSTQLSNMHIAILDDDISQTELLTHWLHRAGHHPHSFDRGIKLLEAIEEGGVDLLLLDWNVPDMDGIEVLIHVRRILRSSIPVLFVTARTGEDDVIKALREGPDDYVTKPVRRMELLARIEAVARSAGYLRDQLDVFEVGCFLVDYKARKIVRTKTAIQLTLKEFELSVLLLRNVGRLLPRRYILETIWTSIPADHSRTLDTHMARVRSKLGLMPQHGWRLSVVYGHGYRLDQLEPSVPAILRSGFV